MIVHKVCFPLKLWYARALMTRESCATKYLIFQMFTCMHNAVQRSADRWREPPCEKFGDTCRLAYGPCKSRILVSLSHYSSRSRYFLYKREIPLSVRFMEESFRSQTSNHTQTGRLKWLSSNFPASIPTFSHGSSPPDLTQETSALFW